MTSTVTSKVTKVDEGVYSVQDIIERIDSEGNPFTVNARRYVIRTDSIDAEKIRLNDRIIYLNDILAQIAQIALIENS